jgi:hypothetical protein
MIKFQYYNKDLTKSQIEQILNNYKLKYTTLTNEINSKLNSLIKTILRDISPFLENIESISKDLKSLKEMDIHKKKIELLENKLREKSKIENQLQNDIISLKKEITALRENKIKQNDSTDNLLKRNDNITSPKRPNKLRKKTFELNNIDDHSQSISISSEPKSSRRYNNKKMEENSSKSTTLNNHSNSIINKREKEKNKLKNNYMMNMQEITRSINGYHNQIQATRNSEKISKFICFSNKKLNKNETRNKKSKKDKSKSIDLSNSVETITKNRKYNINNELLLKDYNIIEEDIEDEIKDLEIDEENILKLIEDIQNFQNINKVI